MGDDEGSFDFSPLWSRFTALLTATTVLRTCWNSYPSNYLLNIVLLETECKSGDLSQLSSSDLFKILFFNIYSNDSHSNFNFTEKNYPFSIYRYHYCSTVLFSSVFFPSEMHQFFFLLPIATSSKLLKGFIWYIFLI